MIHRDATRAFLAGLCLVAFCGTPALADDSEIFLGATNTGVPPNIMLILDTSGSMGTEVSTQTPYDPETTYAGSCATNGYYFAQSANNSSPPDCSGNGTFIGSAEFKCTAALPALGFGPGSGAPGFYTDQFVRWRRSGQTYSWSSAINRANSTDVDCQGDVPGTAPFPTTYSGNQNNDGVKWTNNANANYWTSGATSKVTYTFYSGNYLNWYNFNRVQSLGTRMSIVKTAATNLINSLNGVNVGLMRYSTNDGNSNDSSAAGGMVMYPVADVATNRNALVNAVNSYQANGWTPLSETLFEAYRYFSGGSVLFGNSSKVYSSALQQYVATRSVAGSRTGNNAASNQYQTPMQYSCQKNFVVFLTDGLPTMDNQADAPIGALPNSNALGGSCDNTNAPPYSNLPGGWGPPQTSGKCLAKLSQYMFKADLDSTLSGQQNVQTYFIGFGDDPALAQAFGYLQAAASRGGGSAYTASDLGTLQSVLTNIVSNILQTSTTFTAPTVSVNAFNRTQTLDDLYVSVFQPANTFHWPGNVKKYKLTGGQIVDANGTPAVDAATGFFKDSAQSYWSAAVDGSAVVKGGAASRIPSWNPAAADGRKLYTYVGATRPGAPVTLSGNANHVLTTSNALVTQALLGVGSDALRTNVIEYARGRDVRDEDGDGDTTESRQAMGDPMHAQPAVIIYGGTTAAPDVNDAVVFAPTNDGFLHAIDAQTGVELWAFVPQELLPRLRSTYTNAATNGKSYALDGSVRLLKYDINGDGIVDASAGDRVLIFFGQGRGGSTYFAMDVTDRNAPKYLWSMGPGELPGIGQAWSTPAIARVNVSGASQNNQKIVLIFGGGYDPGQENPAFVANDTVGRAIYMVDALYGTLLWSAAPADASLNLAAMTHSIPSDVTVLDIDGDGFADRMYVGDMAAQLWRFDIYSGNAAASLVAGGAIGSFGAKVGAASAANTRRFYNAPDVAAVQKAGVQPHFNIAIGSGYRGHPLDTTAQDRFYAIRDYQPFVKLTQAQYDAYTVVTDAALDDITGNAAPVLAAGSKGWKLLLNQPGNAWNGEKVLSQATTFNNQVLFTTYTPNAAAAANPCQPGIGANRLYAVSVLDGRPVANLNNQNNLNIADRYTGLSQAGIAPNLSFMFPPPASAVDADGEPLDPNSNNRPVVCMSGAEVLGVCRSFQSRIKTYWSESGAQ